MATNPDQDEFLEDDEQDEIARRSIFSAGWFRALLVLTVLAIVVVVSLPYLLNWLEPTPPPPAKTQAKSSAPAPGPAGAPPATSSPTPTLIPAPAASAPPAPAAPSPAERPIGTAPLPVVPAPATPAAKPGPGAKPAPTAKPTPAAQPAPAARPAPAAQAEAPRSAPAPKRSGAAEGGSPGGYWVQVGAFLEEKNAEALAKQLRGENFPVQLSAVTRGGAPVPAPAKTSGGQNQLFITGSTPDAVNSALKGKGTAQAVKGGVQVNPPFDLETAMSLSSSLKKEGFKVVIRRAKGAAAPKTAAGGGPTYHVVRVGGYPDRTKAQQARGELEAKGHPGFLTQGTAR
ncbi:MAG: SPOR domain-containing protein [Candidatus Rokubacteria bacterium]|nr:SPOR domain-containing protein [Candidatus Rokubacteria bacterium]